MQLHSARVHLHTLMQHNIMAKNYWHLDGYNSPYAFSDQLKRASTNKAFSKRYQLASTLTDASFFGTSTMQEADDLLQNGYADGLKDMLEDKGGVPFDSTRSYIERRTDFVGQRPHIVNAIVGRPKTMVHRIKQEREQKTITLYYNVGVGESVANSQIIRAGKNFLALCQYLERHSYRVRIEMAAAACTRGDDRTDSIFLHIKCKDYSQPLNPLMLAYPLVHPAFFRRHIFRYIEVAKNTDSEAWTFGYGSAYFDSQRIIDAFRDKKQDAVRYGISKDGYLFNNADLVHANTIDDLLKIMDKQKIFK